MLEDDLRAVLNAYPALLRPTGPILSLGNAGGASGANLWRFPSQAGPLVARLWPPDGPGASHLARVHGWLAEAASASLDFVPIPLATVQGRTIQERGGRLWELTPWKSGRAELSRPPSIARLKAGFAALAAIHQAWGHHRADKPSPGLIRRARELESLVGGGFASLRTAIDASPLNPLRDLATRWWEAARSRAALERRRLGDLATRPRIVQPCLRDARADHFLFENDHLSGLIDFGAADFETPAADLSRLLGDWVGTEPIARAEALSAYAAIRRPVPEELALLDAFGRPAAILAGAHWAFWHFLEHRAFDDPDAVGRGLRRSLERMAELG